MVGWHHRLYGHEFEQALGVVMDREPWRAALYGDKAGHSCVTELN